MNQPRIKSEYSSLISIGAHVETTRNWGIERNRLILTKANEKEVAGQQKGIRVLTGLTAKAQKAAGKAVDIVIDGKTLTVNKASFIKWCQRTMVGEQLLKDRKPLIFNSSFIQEELNKHISIRPSGAALLDHSNPEAQRAAMEQLHELVENARTSPRSSKQPSPTRSATNSPISSSRSFLRARSLPNNQSDKTADSLMEDAELMIPQFPANSTSSQPAKLTSNFLFESVRTPEPPSGRSYAQVVTEGEPLTLDPKLVGHFSQLTQRNLNFDANEAAVKVAPVEDNASEDPFSSIDPAMVDQLKAQMEALQEGETTPDFREILGDVASIEDLNQAAIETEAVDQALVTEGDSDEELDRIHQKLVQTLSKKKDDDEIEAIGQLSNIFQQSDVEQTPANSSADKIETTTSKPSESTTAADKHALSTAQQTTRTVKSKKSRKLSAPKFIMLTFATTAIASLAIWCTRNFSDTESLTLENLENDFSTCPLDPSTNISQMAQTTLTYACEAFHYLTSDQFQFDAIRALFKANTDFFNFVQSQESFSCFLGNTAQAGYDIIAPVAKDGLDQVADSIEMTLHGFGSYVQQATDHASHLLNNTIIPNLQPMMAPLSNGINTTIETVQSFFVHPGYTMNHAYDGWKDYIPSSTLGQLPPGIPEKGTNPMTPDILNWTIGQSHRLIQ